MQNLKSEHEIINLSKQKWRWMSECKIDSLATLFHEKAVFVHMGGTMSKEQELDVIRSGGDSLQERGYPGSVGAVYWREDCHPFE